MDYSAIVVASIVGFAINLLLIYYIVQSATKNSTQMRYLRTQIKLLVKIAQASGIAEPDIEEIVKPRKKSK